MLPQARVSGVKSAAPRSLILPRAVKHAQLLRAHERRVRFAAMTPEQVHREADALRLRLVPVGGR